MKLNNILLGLGLSVLGLFAQAQNGLENILVERYYVSNAADAAASVGVLPIGSVTYRVYADMLPGYKFQAAFGDGTRNLKITTTTSFFNNEDRGATSPTFTKANAALNTVMLDSWISVGAAAAGQFGILKAEDNGVANVVHPAGVLANNVASMGIPLTTQDGLIAGAPQSLSSVGDADGAYLALFDATSQVGGSFIVANGAWASTSGSVGPTATNRVLIGQFTTDGIFHIELNIQIGTSTGGTEKYVLNNPTGVELTAPFLSQTFYPAPIAPVVSITSPVAGTTFTIGAAVAIAADATDADGTVSQVEFFVDGVSIGIDATTPYTASYTGLTELAHSLTAVATDNDGQTTTSAPVSFNVGNAPPAVSITAPAAASTSLVGDVVTISATAADPDGSVASVEFFVDGVSAGIDNVTPYTVNYTGVLGIHSLTAKATDNNGKFATSAPVSITVNANQLPSVAITAPVSGAAPALNAPLTVTASASDADGTIVSVEFFNGAASLGTISFAPFELTFTPLVAGSTSLTAKATDNKGGVKVSAPVNVVITDLSAAYALGTVSQVCNIASVCLPITTNNNTVTNVNGYNFSVKYDKTRVTPTGNITVSNLLVQSFLATGQNADAITDYTTTIDAVNGIINIGIFFNSTGGANAAFTGNGQVACIEFNKNAAFQIVDTAQFSFTEIIESYKSTGALYKVGSDGKLISYREDKFYGSLKYWSDLSPIVYDAANPASYLVTNILGCGSSVNVVQPDMSGDFIYSILNGTSIDIRRDIANGTSVHSLITANDAYLTAVVSVKGSVQIGLTPSVYQMIAMDVNRDGLITAGDATQINQRAVSLIGEFSQIGGLGKDWSFIANSKVNSGQLYSISSTFPENDHVGYSKYSVPVVDVCQAVPVTDAADCPIIDVETYVGVLLGDVDATYAGITHDGVLKSAEAGSEIVFDLTKAVVNNGNISIPVSLTSTDVVNSFDFDVVLNDQKVAVKSVDTQFGMNLSWNYIANDKTLSVASYSLNAIPTAQSTASLMLIISGTDALSSTDFNSTLALINGKPVTLKVVDASTVGLDPKNRSNKIQVYPNPASDKLNIEVSSDSKVQILDLNGKRVGAERNVSANQKQVIDVTNLAKGIYMVRISNNQSVEVKKIVIK